MKIIPDFLPDSYRNQSGVDFKAALQQLDKTFVGSDSFDFYTFVAVITSSKVEGEPMEVDSYLNRLGIFYEQLDFTEAEPFWGCCRRRWIIEECRWRSLSRGGRQPRLISM